MNCVLRATKIIDGIFFFFYMNTVWDVCKEEGLLAYSDKNENVFAKT